MNDNTFTLIDNEGKEVKAQILFTYYSEEFKKHYVVFMPENANGEVAAASYNEENATSGSLEPITTDEEWELLEDLLEEYVENLEKEHECHCQGECHCGGDCDDECECDCDEEECCCHKNAN